MKQFHFRLDLSAAACEGYYRGQVSQVVARCADGASVQFPAQLIRPHLTTSGVHGMFILTCDDSGKNSELQKV